MAHYNKVINTLKLQNIHSFYARNIEAENIQFQNKYYVNLTIILFRQKKEPFINSNLVFSKSYGML